MAARRSALVMALMAAFGIVTSGWGNAASAADLAGSRDHSLVNVRYPEAEIYGYEQVEFGEHRLLTGEVAKEKEPTVFQDLEGEVTTIDYWVPKERSTLEVMRNYELALADLGFEAIYTCKNEACGGRNGRPFNLTVVPYCCGFGGNHADQRYLAGRLDRAEGPVYVSLYVVKNTSEGGPRKDRVNLRLVVVETQPMDVGMKIVKAEEMRDALRTEGRVAIHSILFAFDSADIETKSRPALDEIGKLLRAQGDLKLLIVGHTDNQGALDYNLDLSKRRARSVAKDLVATYGIDAARLSGHGVGFLAPIAPNTSEAGRALNRRVELVPR
ncbi:MAG TPA: OmpA family protein [Thermoleophilia bacterium]|nr:OmpA family protein [Thermoleophilia bacterium]